MYNTSGWRRIVIIIIVLWVLGVTWQEWAANVDRADAIADSAKSMCNYFNEKNGTNDDCWEAYKKIHSENIEITSVEYINWIGSVLFIPIATLITWVFILAILKIYSWVRNGFNKEWCFANYKKKAAVLTLIIWVLGFIAYHILPTYAEKTEAFNKALAKCEMMAIEKKVSQSQYNDYILACMRASDYNFKHLKNGCFINDLSVKYSYCYEE